MNGRILKVALAIATGFLSGVGLALKLGGGLTWICPFVGGLVGYLAYEWKETLAAIPKAWRAATSWHPNWPAIRHGLKVTLLFGLAWTMTAINVLVSVHVIVVASGGWRPDVSVTFVAVFCSFFGLVILATLRKPDKVLGEVHFKKYIRVANPIAVYLYWPLWGIIWVIPRIPKIIRVIARFLWHLFRLIHSEGHLIAGVWALIGVTAWLLTDTFWISGLGAILGGIVSYAVIGQRLLKLIPFHNHA